MVNLSAWAAIIVLMQTSPGRANPSEERVVNAAVSERVAAAEKGVSVPQASTEAAVKAAGTEVPASAPAAAASPAPSAATWSGTVGLALVSLTGNAQSRTFSTTAAAERKSETWIYALKATGAYGTSQAAGTTNSEVVALFAGV